MLVPPPEFDREPGIPDLPLAAEFCEQAGLALSFLETTSSSPEMTNRTLFGGENGTLLCMLSGPALVPEDS